jgi:hypothetical protein
MTSTTPPSTAASLRLEPPSALRSALVQALESKVRRRSRRRLADYRPYTKQIEFHAAGAAVRERLLMAGNQLGKTYCGAAEAAIHLTGLYPAWWGGRRFARPVRAWAGSKTGEVILHCEPIGRPRAELSGVGVAEDASVLVHRHPPGQAERLYGGQAFSHVGVRRRDLLEGADAVQDVVGVDRRDPGDVRGRGRPHDHASASFSQPRSIAQTAKA